MTLLLELLDSTKVLIAFCVAVGVVIFIHEFGHYIAARFCGLYAEAFSIGFGPAIIKRTDRHGTVWKLSLLPLGGYVKFQDTLNPKNKNINVDKPADRNDVYLGATPLLNRTIIVAAGPFANFAMAIILFALIVTWSGLVRIPITVDTLHPLPDGILDLRSNDAITSINGVQIDTLNDLYIYGWQTNSDEVHLYKVVRNDETRVVAGPHPTPVIIGDVMLRSAAEKSGLQRGDVILFADSVPVKNFLQLQDVVKKSANVPVRFDVWRNGEVLTIWVKGQVQDVPLSNGEYEKRVMIGITQGLAFELATYTPGPLTALYIGLTQTWSIVSETFNGLANLIARQISTCNIQGILGIAQISGSAADRGIDTFLTIIAVISVAVGVMNLLPIPVLDGGHLTMFIYEAITGKPPGDNFLKFAFRIGLMLIFCLLVFTVYQDLTCSR